MAKREALRELQTRLASRLQAARLEGVGISWLAVSCDGANFLFPLAQAGEIFPLVNLQQVPYSASWFIGVLNLRGGLFGVVDLASFLGRPTGQGRNTPIPAEANVVTLNTALEVNCALQIDALAGLRNPESFVSSEAAPPGAPDFFGKRMTDSTGAVWQEINLRTLSRSPDFLNISA